MTREEAVDWLNNIRDDIGWVRYSELWHYDQALAEIIDMLEAEPERKTGHWVNNIHDLPICDQCGYMTPYDRAIDDYEYGNYCPNCGAKMEGEQQ